MKTKKLSKKLGLNKKTIVNLETNDMKKLYGGFLGIWTDTCPSACPVGPCGP